MRPRHGGKQPLAGDAKAARSRERDSSASAQPSEPSPEEPLTGTKADVLHAAHIAGEVALKLIKPGNTNQQVTRAISKVAEAFGVNCVAGALSHQMKRCARGGGGGGARKRPQPIPSLPFP